MTLSKPLFADILKPLVLLALSQTLTACANSPAERFEIFRDQLSSAHRIDVVIDSFGLNDIKGKNPGLIIEKNQKLSENLQHNVLAALKTRGYVGSVLAATIGVHVQEHTEGATIYYAEGNEPTARIWKGPVFSEQDKVWGGKNIIDYFNAALVETEFVNRKTTSKLAESIERGNIPRYRLKLVEERRKANSPEEIARRKNILQNIPAVLAESTADIILFVKVAGSEINRAKSLGASALLGAASFGASGGSSVLVASYRSITLLEAVAIDKRTGQVVWTAHDLGARYSDAPDLIPLMIASFPDRKR